MRAMRINTKKKECANASDRPFTMFSHCVYGYNIRNELVSATKNSEYTEYQYQYDDIGNRLTSLDLGTNRTYIANNLNQYTSISNSAASALSAGEFVPQFDDDGNQTLIKTATGIWQGSYNGENRPVLWENVSTNSPTPSLISMSYDRMGRRVTKNNQRFVYDGYLQIANFEHSTSSIKLQTFIWDPTEPVATRPLVWLVLRSLGEGGYYAHDGNKNVSEVVTENGNIAAHYDYAPFGAVIAQHGASVATNPWRFSSEYAEDDTATVYYNYRHYEPVMGKWLSRDLIEEDGGVINIYSYLDNTFGLYSDWLGEFPVLQIFQTAFKSAFKEAAKSFIFDILTSWYDITLDNGRLVNDAIFSCSNGEFDFHEIKLYSPRDTSVVVKAFRKGLKDGITSLVTETLTGSLSEVIRSHASDFLKANPKSAYYEYYKKIEKLITKEGAEELTDEMVNAISGLAIRKIKDISSLINNVDIVSDNELMVKWMVEDKCRICAIVKESYKVTLTIMGDKQPSFQVDGPEKKRCFDYEKLGDPAGREARRACSLCPCKRKRE